jgi:hypothetical protein
MNITDLVGKRVNLYGVDNNVFCVSYRGTRYAFEAVEDEDDGYRSMMSELRTVPLKGHVFFRTPVARVTVSKLDGSFDGYVFKDADGHEWLLVGTDSSDDYYPCFTVRWTPKAKS